MRRRPGGPRAIPSPWGAPASIALLSMGAALAFQPDARAFGMLQDLYTSPQAQAMGNAYNAVVDDMDSIFYNPAGLAGVKQSGLTLASIDLQASSNIYSSYKTLSQISSLNSTTVNSLMGNNYFTQGRVTAGYVQSGFGIAVFSDQQTALMTQNQALPQVTLGDQTTSGVAFGYAYTVGGKRHRRHSKSELRIGFGGEALIRRGGYYTLTPTELLNLGVNEFHQLIGNYGYGFGVNAGTQYIYHVNKRFSLMASGSWIGIGDIHFSSGAQTQYGNLSTGIGARYDFPFGHLIADYDYQNITQSTDYRMRQHVGLQLGLPLVTLYGGLNQTYPSYGFSTDLWAVRLTALTYTEEWGSLIGEDPERCYEMRFSFGFGI